MSKVKITVEYKGEEPFIFTADEVDMKFELGLQTYVGLDGEAKRKHSGQKRMLLKAWKGCHDYNDFQENTVIRQSFL